MKEPKSEVVLVPERVSVEIDGIVVGRVEYEDVNFVMFYAKDGVGVGADEMIEIGKNMKRLEKE